MQEQFAKTERLLGSEVMEQLAGSRVAVFAAGLMIGGEVVKDIIKNE